MSIVDNDAQAMIPYFPEQVCRMFYNMGYLMMKDDRHDLGKFAYYNQPHYYNGRKVNHHPSPLHHWPLGIGFMTLGQIGGMFCKVQEMMTTVEMDENGDVIEIEELGYMADDQNNDGRIDHEQYYYHHEGGPEQFQQEDPIYLNQQQQTQQLQEEQVYQPQLVERSYDQSPRALPAPFPKKAKSKKLKPIPINTTATSVGSNIIDIPAPPPI
jgi:hypothetical protein